MPRLALYTFGVLQAPLADPAPVTREFHDSGEAVYRRITQHPGYLAHAEAGPGDSTTFDERPSHARGYGSADRASGSMWVARARLATMAKRDP